MQHVSILIDGDGGTLERRQQHAAQRVAERQAEAPLERLGDDRRGRTGSTPASVTGFSGLIRSASSSEGTGLPL